jgi:putative phage-type endonuclease
MNNIVQGTEEWFAARAGKVTASRIADVLATIKSGESAARRNYRTQLVCERLTGKIEETFSNSHMERGIALEPYAREAYELQTGSIVEQVGFIDHPAIQMSGASPDGLVGSDGSIEIKCPTPANHIEYLLGKEPPSKYKPQMTWQMLCAERQWVDFVSYCPEMPAHLQLFVVRFVPEAEYSVTVAQEVIKFLAEVDETIAKLMTL